MKGTGGMKLRTAVLAVLLFAFTATELYAEFSSECNGPTELVKVTGKEVGVSPRIYLYTITNKLDFPIYFLKVGTGKDREPEMMIMPDNVPISVGSPEAWEGHYVFHEEGSYMHIYWSATHEVGPIGPGKSLNGFTVVLPALMVYPDGKTINPVDMKKLPFTVLFGDSKCVWGRVVEEK